LARLFADENFPQPVVDALCSLGHDALTTQQLGVAGVGLSDRSILAAAASDDRAVITLDRKHFIRLHSRVESHAGIIVCSADPDSVSLAARIHDAVARKGELRNQLLRIVRPNR